MTIHHIKTSLGSDIGELGSNERGYYWKLPNGLIFQWGYHHLGSDNKIEFPIKFPNKCISLNVSQAISNITSPGWGGDERHPIIRTDVNKITDSFEYEDRGVDSHYGLQSIFWSAIGN